MAAHAEWIVRLLGDQGTWLLASAGGPPAWLASPAMRVLAAGGIALLAALLGGWGCIPILARHCSAPLASASSTLRQLHAHKRQTPTMGGLFLVGSLLLAMGLAADWRNPSAGLIALTVFGLFLVGVVDDRLKLRRRGRGLTARGKLAGQAAVAIVAAVWLWQIRSAEPLGPVIHLPATAHAWPLGWWLVPWSAVVIVASSNAVNLTDGLDGLAAGCMLTALAAIGALAWAAGIPTWALRTCIGIDSGAVEATVAAAAAGGATLGFLWFNRFPARVFMGDTGSLPLGGLLGLLALIARCELLLVVIGGVFVAETLSVIVQVGAYRLSGRRVFRCAPLHHHFQFAGWPERALVHRFWLASLGCAAVGLAVGMFGGAAHRTLPRAQFAPTEAAQFEAPKVMNTPTHGTL
jgi:phospho-N-acetylmuramoyl-pentapeptide-transferase